MISLDSLRQRRRIRGMVIQDLDPHEARPSLISCHRATGDCVPATKGSCSFRTKIDLLNSAAKPMKFISIPTMFRIRRKTQEFELAMLRSVVKEPGSCCIQDNCQSPINCRHTRHDRARKQRTYLL
jgi:hypothetical protein